MLDTLKISKRFIEAGMPKKEAEVIAEVFKDCEDVFHEKLATKADIKSLKHVMTADLKDIRGEFDGNLKDIRNEFGSEIKGIKGDIACLKVEIRHLREYMKISSVLMTFGFAALGSLIAYLSPH